MEVMCIKLIASDMASLRKHGGVRVNGHFPDGLRSFNTVPDSLDSSKVSFVR